MSAEDIRPIDRLRVVPAPSGEPGAVLLLEPDGTAFSVPDRVEALYEAGAFASQRRLAERAALARQAG